MIKFIKNLFNDRKQQYNIYIVSVCSHKYIQTSDYDRICKKCKNKQKKFLHPYSIITGNNYMWLTIS